MASSLAELLVVIGIIVVLPATSAAGALRLP
jgi:hypothetical protein